MRAILVCGCGIDMLAYVLVVTPSFIWLRLEHLRVQSGHVVSLSVVVTWDDSLPDLVANDRCSLWCGINENFVSTVKRIPRAAPKRCQDEPQRVVFRVDRPCDVHRLFLLCGQLPHMLVE